MTHFDHPGLRARIAALAASVSANDPVPKLVTEALGSGRATLSADGALAVETGAYTGRSASDKFIVRDGVTEGQVWWENANAVSPEQFEALFEDMCAALGGKQLFAQDLAIAADPRHRLSVRLVTDSAWHALFARNLLMRPDPPPERAEATIIHLPGFTADPKRHGTRTGTVIALDLARKLILIGGTGYAGEIKKAMFSLFNYHAPEADVLPMHCSANIGPRGDVALFFGLSGTGKTTLSSDAKRPLIGDDEHGWSDAGIFNLEGGCYAKTIGLDAPSEPEIYRAARRFGTVLENVVLDPKTLVPDFADDSRTENTRAAYPLDSLEAVHPGGVAPPPRTVVFLTADAFGVLPPIARLDPDQAVEQFLLGYTAKVAGTERGVKEPQATFSACFGAPFMPRHPSVYGEMLKRRLEQTRAAAWLINTGWTGGGYGVGRRIGLAVTRRLVDMVLSGRLADTPMRRDPIFGLAVPRTVEGVDAAILDPASGWADRRAHERQALKLRAMFAENFARLGLEEAAAHLAAPRAAAE